MTAQAPALGNNYRVTHLNDAVPQLPPMWFGYQHISPEYYISADTGKNVSLTNITVLPGYENPLGNYQWNRMSVNAHGWYFNPISACYNGPPLDLGWTVTNATNMTMKPTPEKDWLSAALGQLATFMPVPPKGIVPLAVPAGPNSHGQHPPDTGLTPSGADTSSTSGVDDDERVKKIPIKSTFTDEMGFPDMTRDEMEKHYGFDRMKVDRRKAKRRSLIPYGGPRKYLM
jgi:hypothetical protein